MSPETRDSVPTLDDLAGDWQAPARLADFSLPAITTRLGTLQAAWSPTGFQNFTLPPTGLPTPTARLLRFSDGHARLLDGVGVRYRWRAYQVERELDAPGLRVRSELRLASRQPLALERLHLEAPDGPERVFIVVEGLARVWQFTDYWNLPEWDVPQENAWWDGRRAWLDDTKTFGAAAFTPLTPPRSVTVAEDLADLTARLEDGRPGLEGRGRVVALEYLVDGTLDLDLAVEQGAAPPEDAAGWWAPDASGFGAAFDAARDDWEATWQAAFTPGNREFGGHLPRLKGAPEAVERLYYSGVIALLNSRREFRVPGPREKIATGGQAIWSRPVKPAGRYYTWGGTEGAPTTSFLWELQMQAPLLAMLDPQVLREQIETTLGVDIHSHWGFEGLSGRGAGMWYGVNDGAVLTVATDYLRATGDLAWLDRPVNGRSVREHLLDAATYADRRGAAIAPGGAGSPLADFGEAQNILECVSRYEHRVASLNALFAWGLRQAARLAPGQAPGLEARAAEVSAATRGLLEPGGFFACLRPTPSGELERTPVRTVLDFVYVSRYLTDDLSPDERAAMTGFVQRELMTPTWLLALSQQDEDAFTQALPSFQRYRADHQATGSYDAWPALVASGLVRLGRAELVLPWMEGLATATREGAFCQAHYVGTTEAERQAGHVARSSFTNGNCATEACGCAFTTTILEDLYGLRFTLDRPGVPQWGERLPGLTGEVLGLKA